MSKNKRNNTSIIKAIVEENLNHMEKPKLSDIVNLIRPFCKYTKSQLIERELKNKARYIMRQYKDKNGVRTYFLDNEGVYINIERNDELTDLSKVESQLNVKYSGISMALEKVKNRISNVTAKLRQG